MIPITDSTSLSIERTAKLLQSLVDFKDKNVELPEMLRESVDHLLDAQQTFLKNIDTYLHSDHKDELEILTAIVEPNPEFLATKDWSGMLPCHIEASKKTKSSYKNLKLYAEIGRKHNIGGEEMRGGLLTTYHNKRNTLHFFVHTEPFELLRETSPPSFYIEDVQKYQLLHCAASRCNLDLVKYMIRLDPSSLEQKDGKQWLPIHYFLRIFFHDNVQDVVQYLLQSSVPSNETIGGLFTIHPQKKKFLINYMVDKMGMQKTWDCIERAFSKQRNNLPCILHQTMLHTPEYFSEVIKRFPESVHVRDKNNRLPIHIALEQGMEWSSDLAYLLVTSQEHLKEVDPVTNWPPFVLAGMGESCDFRIIYDLLRKHPEHVEKSGDGKYIWEKRGNCRKRKWNDL